MQAIHCFDSDVAFKTFAAASTLNTCAEEGKDLKNKLAADL